MSLGSGAEVKEQVGVGLGLGGCTSGVYSGFTRLLRQAGIQQLCCRSIGYFALYLGCCYEHLGILFKDAIFHHFLFLALTLRLAPTLILPLPEFLEPPKMLGR